MLDRLGSRLILGLITLVCAPTCGLTLVVSRCHGRRFDTMLCSPGSVIKVTGLTQSTSINGGAAGCPRATTNCTQDISGSNYYQTLLTACDGKSACTDLTATAQTQYCGGITESSYSSLTYDCQRLPVTGNIIQRVHYHTRNYDILLCPVGSVIRVSDLYVGRQQSFMVGDCAKQSENDLEVFRTFCDGHISCTGTYSVRGPIHCEGSSHMSTYTLLVYVCIPSVISDLRSVDRCTGEPFDRELCPVGSGIEVHSVYAGVSQSINTGCRHQIGDCTVRLGDIQIQRDRCDGRQACEGLSSTSSISQYCGGPFRDSSYKMLVYGCVNGTDAVFSPRPISSTVTEITTSSGFSSPQTYSDIISTTYSNVTTTYEGHMSTPREMEDLAGEKAKAAGTFNFLSVAVSVPVVTIFVTIVVVLTVYFVRRRRQSNLPDQVVYVNQVVSDDTIDTPQGEMRTPNNKQIEYNQSSAYEDLLEDNRAIIQQPEYMQVSPGGARYENVQNILTISEPLAYEDVSQSTGDQSVSGVPPESTQSSGEVTRVPSTNSQSTP